MALCHALHRNIVRTEAEARVDIASGASAMHRAATLLYPQGCFIVLLDGSHVHITGHQDGCVLGYTLPWGRCIKIPLDLISRQYTPRKDNLAAEEAETIVLWDAVA